MIGKIAPNGKGARGLANYLLRRGRGRIIAGTMAGLTPRELSREFGALRRLNPKLTKAVAHLMLSPAPGDPPLTDGQWQEIAERYAEAMGYANTAWCGVVHNDTDHQHLHILACRIDIHGKTISDANSYRKSEAIVRRLERDFGLVAVASPTGIKRESQPRQQQTPTTSEEPTTMTDTTPTPPNPFDTSDPQHATWPHPFEPGRDAAQLALVEANPAIVVPSAQPGDTITDKSALAMRRALVEPSYEGQMRVIFGGELTRVHRHGNSATLYFKSPWRIEDSGHKLRVMGCKASEAAQAAASIVRMAVNPPKCWKSITFTGSDAFVLCAMREARKSGIEIIAVGLTQIEILAKVYAEEQGGMAAMAGPVTVITFPIDPILAPLAELDDLPAQTLPRTAPPLAPVVPPAVAPPALPIKALPHDIKIPIVGVLPVFMNLRERLKDRREQRPPAKPDQTPAAPPKKPGPL